MVQCKDVLIGKILIDNGSALNVLLRYLLKEMLIHVSHMKAKYYDGKGV
jgi:hypothetical protein